MFAQNKKLCLRFKMLTLILVMKIDSLSNSLYIACLKVATEPPDLRA